MASACSRLTGCCSCSGRQPQLAQPPARATRQPTHARRALAQRARVSSPRSESLASSYDELQLSSSNARSPLQQQQAGLAAQQQQQAAAGDDPGYLAEYAALKQQLLDNTRKSGGAVGLYLLLTAGGPAALAAMLGSAASYAYVLLLCRDVDAVAPTDLVPIWEANKIENLWLRRAAKVRAAYQKALNPRLLVPAALGLGIGVYNRLSPEPLDLLYAGCLLLGFLAYKLALVVKLVDDLSPKSFGAEAERPVVERFEDELDQWGRPKRRAANPIDVMPEDKQAKAYEELEKQLAREERRQAQ